MATPIVDSPSASVAVAAWLAFAALVAFAAVPANVLLALVKVCKSGWLLPTSSVAFAAVVAVFALPANVPLNVPA